MRRHRPLRAVRVLSFEVAFSLPAAARALSELGADVVRVGRPSGDFPPFVHRTDGSAINKRSVSIDRRFREAIAARGRHEWFEDAARHGLTFAPVDDVYALRESPQLAARGFFEPVGLSDGVQVPGRGCRSGRTSMRPGREHRAPRLGEHNGAVRGAGE